MKYTIDFCSNMKHGVYRYKFVSDVTGGITYCEIDHDNKTYTTNYFKYNGGWIPVPVTLKRIVKAAEQWAKEHGYTEI
jgi:hypothetical protein